ncbi:MAG TPA: tetratricopeptide repeat protein, partial [Gemmatales bacterium]|nr:tetratricopeptide repeat protein [Gemmatales bacterium]
MYEVLWGVNNRFFLCSSESTDYYDDNVTAWSGLMHSFQHLLVITLAVSAAYADDGWVGQQVIPKRGSPEISRTDENGQIIVLGKIDYLPVLVRAEKGEWVKVQVLDTTGWVTKDKVVRMNEGIQYFTHRITNGDDVAEAYRKRAWLWAMKNEPEIAIKDADEAIRLSPSASTYNTRGQAWASKKENDKAIGDYTEAIRLDPKLAAAYYNRGIVWLANKDYEKAIADYSEAIRLKPNYPQPINNLAWLMATCSVDKYRDGKRAVELARQACELSEWSIPGRIATLAAAYAESGNYEQAIKHQKQALTFPDY